MKLSDLKNKLEKYIEERGDSELLFSVRDHYSIYGERAEFFAGNEFWEGFRKVDNFVTMELHLKENYEGKSPKITFRK